MKGLALRIDTNMTPIKARVARVDDICNYNSFINSKALKITASAIQDNNKQTLDDLYTRFIKYIDVKPKTVETYSKAIRQFLKYTAQHGITQPKREDILSYRDYLKENHKPTTVQNYIIALRLFFQWTEQEGFYPNVAEHIKGAEVSRNHKKDYLTSKQVKIILDGITRDTEKGRRDYAIFSLMVTGGLRSIEIQRAKVEDIGTRGDSTVLFLQGKGEDERTEYVKIPPVVEKAIRASLADRKDLQGSQPLFISLSNNNKGGQMTTRAISGLVKKALVNAGYDSDRLTAHSLRHTAVTLSLLAGNDIREAKQFARHSNTNTTEIYAHDLDREKNNCAQSVADLIF